MKNRKIYVRVDHTRETNKKEKNKTSETQNPCRNVHCTTKCSKKRNA